MQGILFLKNCEGALVQEKLESVANSKSAIMNKKAIMCIKVSIFGEILQNIGEARGQIQEYYFVTQVHLMTELDSMQLDASKRAVEYLLFCIDTLSQK